MTKSEHRVRVDNGRYEFIRRETGSIHIDRHGKPWLGSPIGEGAVYSLMCELDAARAVVQAVRHEMFMGTVSDRSRLGRALALHDGLISDREPPSAWCGAEAADSHDVMPMINGKSFRCLDCGANVFRHDPKDSAVFVCNGCGSRYRGEPSEVTTL